MSDLLEVSYRKLGICKEVYEFGAKIENELKDRFDKIIIHNSNLTARDLKDTERIENYIFADEAKDMGIVDFIIGRDCTLDEIL